MLLVKVDSAGGEADRVLRAVRVTDAAMVKRRFAGGWEIRAVIPGDGVARRRVDERLAHALGDAQATVGWATFSREGLTLEGLLEHAARTSSVRAGVDSIPDHASRPGQ